MPSKFGNLVRASADTDRRFLNAYDDYLKHRNMRKEAEAIEYILTKNLHHAGFTEDGERDRSGTWSASSAGTCHRRQQLGFLNFQQRPIDADAMNIFTNGDYLHLRYQVAGLINGTLSDVEVRLEIPDKRVRGTMDGLLAWDEVLEIKSINDRGFRTVKEFGPKREHKYQATAYCIAKDLKSVRFVYENKNTNEAREYLFVPDDEFRDQVLAEWDLLNDATNDKTLLPVLPECEAENGFNWRYCPFSHVCKEAKPWPKVRLVA